MSERVRIETDTVPPSTGFRSQAIIAGGFLFTGGMIGAPLTSEGEVRAPAPTLAEQTDVCLGHLAQVTRVAGAGAEQVVELSAFYTPADGEAVVRSRVERFLGGLPPLFNPRRVSDVALHAFLELDWIATIDPSRSLVEAADILRPFGHGDEMVRSGPFVILNGLTAPGATLGEQSFNLLAEADRQLRGVGSSIERLVKLTVFVADFETYPQFNDATKQVFASFTPPTRSVLVAPHITGPALLKVDLLALA